MKNLRLLATLLLGMLLSCHPAPIDYLNETPQAKDARMAWWRDARFGMFIHWGLYAIPAGEWDGETNHGEWIRTSAQIPLEEYDRFRDQFNPVNFDAGKWVKMAKDAGMKYIVITSKHHDGFCLFDSKQTDFDVMSTPFKRDILKELSDACRAEGIKLGWYHSIMDWHHPDYLPRREWETGRPAEDADFKRYVDYMKAQLRELTENYGRIDVLWFDGEWEETWTHQLGLDLYNYARSLQPDIIVNNRVDIGRSSMSGLTRKGGYAGDFGTPEQKILAMGIPGVDWETCMTMNDHWGYNKNDRNWKSSASLIRKLADIASKGGNLLLNVGPKADGTFPEESVARLEEIGAWMRLNSESIYGTQASPFESLSWGRCTQKPMGPDTRLYLHVFEWPADSTMEIPGIFNTPKSAFLLAGGDKKPLPVSRSEDTLRITLPAAAPDTVNTVVVLDIEGSPDVSHPPTIDSEFEIFLDRIEPIVSCSNPKLEIRYTTDGTMPTPESPLARGKVTLSESTHLSARSFRDGKAVSDSVCASFRKVALMPPAKTGALEPGLRFSYYEGKWDSLPPFEKMTPVKTGKVKNFSLAAKAAKDHYGFLFEGYVQIPQDGVYAFSTTSDDGSRLWIDGILVADNDGLHGMEQASGAIALANGPHAIRVAYFEKDGGDDLKVVYKKSGMEQSPIPDTMVFFQ